MEELKNNETDYELIMVAFIAEILTMDMPDKVRELRFNAIRQLQSRLAFYRERGYMEQLLCAITRKKAEMIMKATSKTEMEQVMKIKAPHFDGNKFTADEYSVPEEEMISWAETSLKAPLNEYGFRRYMELFQQIFPEQAAETFNKI